MPAGNSTAWSTASRYLSIDLSILVSYLPTFCRSYTLYIYTFGFVLKSRVLYVFLLGFADCFLVLVRSKLHLM
jgi:hypothetical protein